ncbi:MAG TPA: homogentisate phytyltransferase [Chloroflexaceae bacterium]|nr:homogentisate phytyltransferase [Chloroflexaceae bacterium]
MRALRTLVGFARPHTVIATTVQVVTILLIVAERRAFAPEAAALAAMTLAACLALNLYVVGLNQLTDVPIDLVNKPWLPVAAGELSPRDGRLLVAGAAVTAVTLAAISGPYLLLTVALIMLIGTAYSLPPMRLKRWPVAAALSIAAARGVIANVGLGLHYGSRLGGDLPAATLAVLGLFFFGFGLVIAIYKDLPDSAGDRLYRIETFTTRLGPQRALDLGRAVLTACYALPIGLALAGLPGRDALFLLVSHGLIVAAFWVASARVDLARQRSVSSFYMFLWALFYAEFAVLSIYALARGVA